MFKNNYFLLRHGQTIYQKENRQMNYDAKENPLLHLTEEGEEMVKETVAEMKGQKIDMIFASPYQRTKETAKIASEMIGVKEINFDQRLVDINLGIYMGKPMEESHKFYLGKSPSFDNRPEGGESWNDILARVKEFLDEVDAKYENKNILIVSHADPIWLMLGYLREYKNEEEFLKMRFDREKSYPKLGQLMKT